VLAAVIAAAAAQGRQEEQGLLVPAAAAAVLVPQVQQEVVLLLVQRALEHQALQAPAHALHPCRCLQKGSAKNAGEMLLCAASFPPLAAV